MRHRVSSHFSRFSEAPSRLGPRSVGLDRTRRRDRARIRTIASFLENRRKSTARRPARARERAGGSTPRERARHARDDTETITPRGQPLTDPSPPPRGGVSLVSSRARFPTTASNASKHAPSVFSCENPSSCFRNKQDPDYPARELHFHTPQTRGWQCARFSKFPQELVLRLDHPARIHQIQLLSHEYKIATKIELFTGLLPPGETSLDRAIMRRLGHLSFDPNTASGHQARELKSVHVNVDAAILRVVVHKCHVNKLNIYNQVGIVALNIIGEPIAPMDNGLGNGGYDGLAPGPRPPRHAGVADMSLDLDVDPVTASKIREIHAQKENAVAREDYDEAKRLRDGINRLKAVGAKVAQLEHRKRSAIEAEDYDAAKVIKSEIDKLREAGGVVALGESVGAGSGGGGGAREDIFNRALAANDGNVRTSVTNSDVLKVHPQSPGGLSNASGRAGVVEEYQPKKNQAYGAAPEFESDYVSYPATAQSTPVRPDPREFEQAVGQGLSPSQLAKIRDNAGPDDVPPVGNEYQAALKSNWAYDDRPAVSKAAAAETAFAGTPQRFRDDGGPLSHNFDPSSVGGNNDEVVARATGAPRVPSGMDEEFPGDSKTNGDGASRFGPGDVPAGFNADLPPPRAHLLVARRGGLARDRGLRRVRRGVPVQQELDAPRGGAAQDGERRRARRREDRPRGVPRRVPVPFKAVQGQGGERLRQLVPSARHRDARHGPGRGRERGAQQHREPRAAAPGEARRRARQSS